MTILNRVRVLDVNGSRLACIVDHVHGWLDDGDLEPSRTLALYILWETVLGWLEITGGGLQNEHTVKALRLSPLGQALAGLSMHDDESWSRATVERFFSCVGVTGRENCDEMWTGPDHEGWDDQAAFAAKERTKAVYHIATTDPRWLAHLTPGMECDSTAHDQDVKVVVDPLWRTFNVLALAHGIDADLAYDRSPILADALEDAGCNNEQLLGHFRSPRPHSRGCWAIDLLLREQ
jgi:hypothetical protein